MGDIFFEEPMSKHTSFKVGGPVEVFAAPDTIDYVQKLILWARSNNIPCMTIGEGTNLLVKDAGFRGILLVLTRIKEKIHVIRKPSGSMITAGAGTKLGTLCGFAIKNGLSGMNFALGIPGTIGGALCMNAGTSMGSMEDVIDSVTVICSDGSLKKIMSHELRFSYRNLVWPDGCITDPPVVIRCTLKLGISEPSTLKEEAKMLMKKRKSQQPYGSSSAGCFFKNPPSEKTAGELIELAGLKGVKNGGAQISARHANFILNLGGAKSSEILQLKRIIQQEVWDKFKVRLICEVKIIGDSNA